MNNKPYTIIKNVGGYAVRCRVHDEQRVNTIVQVYEDTIEWLGKIYEPRGKKVNGSDDKGDSEIDITSEYSAKKVSWNRLRSEVYLRDRGICWICNKFVSLDIYQAGHIVDRRNNGQDTFDNVVTMHRKCNNHKPYHDTLEEALRWRLTYSTPVNPQSNTIPKENRRRKQRITLKPVKANSYNPPSELLDPSDIVKRFKDINHQDNKTSPQQIEVQPQTSIQQEEEKGFSYGHYRAGNYGYKQKQYKSPTIKTAKSPKATPQELLAKIVPNTICWIQGRPMGTGELRPMWRVLPPPYRQEDMFTMRETPSGAIDNGSSSPKNTIQIINGRLEQKINLTLGRANILVKPDANGKPSITFSHSNLSNKGGRSQTVGLGIGQIPLHEWYQAKAQGITFQEFTTNYHTPRAIASQGR